MLYRKIKDEKLIFHPPHFHGVAEYLAWKYPNLSYETARKVLWEVMEKHGLEGFEFSVKLTKKNVREITRRVARAYREVNERLSALNTLGNWLWQYCKILEDGRVEQGI